MSNQNHTTKPLLTQARSHILTKGNELYDALQSGDGDSLKILLSNDFQGCLSAGLPRGLGRKYDGLEAMMGEGWAIVDELFQLDVKVENLFDAGELLIGQGSYEGNAKTTGKEIRAAFAHFWQFDGNQFKGLRQVTDTGMWRDALM